MEVSQRQDTKRRLTTMNKQSPYSALLTVSFLRVKWPLRNKDSVRSFESRPASRLISARSLLPRSSVQPLLHCNNDRRGNGGIIAPPSLPPSLPEVWFLAHNKYRATQKGLSWRFWEWVKIDAQFSSWNKQQKIYLSEHQNLVSRSSWTDL